MFWIHPNVNQFCTGAIFSVFAYQLPGASIWLILYLAMSEKSKFICLKHFINDRCQLEMVWIATGIHALKMPSFTWLFWAGDRSNFKLAEKRPSCWRYQSFIFYKCNYLHILRRRTVAADWYILWLQSDNHVIITVCNWQTLHLAIVVCCDTLE